MSKCNFSVRDVRFRRAGDDECHIVVYGQTLGMVTRRSDIANPAGGSFYVLHMYDDVRGHRLVDDIVGMAEPIVVSNGGAGLRRQRSLVPRWGSAQCATELTAGHCSLVAGSESWS